MASRQKKFIDVEQVLQEKNPRLAKVLPRFIVNYIKKKIHQDYINEGIELYKDVYHLDFNQAALDYLGLGVEWTGAEHVPEKGGVIIAGNHPLGGLDGMGLIKAVSSRRKDIRFLVNDILTKLENFHSLFVAVNKVGTNTKEALKTIESVYSSEDAVLIFPAGLVSRKQKGKIEDLEWKKSFITKAIEYNKPVIPAYIEGKNSDFFYNFALWRKRLGIKANIEMFFLSDEMVKQRGQVLKVYFGKPIPASTFDKSRTHYQWAQLVKKFVYEMKQNAELDFSDFLKRSAGKV